MPEVGALRSTGVTRLRHYYDPVRLPPWPSPEVMSRLFTSAATGLPRCPNHFAYVPCPLPRRIETGACVDCFPARVAFPILWVGRHPHCPFRGLLRLHSRYGPHACSTTQGGLCHGASTGPVARPRRPSATSSIDNSLGGTLLHKCFAPSRRTRVCRRRRSIAIHAISIVKGWPLNLRQHTPVKRRGA